MCQASDSENERPCSFMVRVTSAKFNCFEHAKRCRLENMQITSVLSAALDTSKLQLFFARAHSTHSTLATTGKNAQI